MPIKYVKGDIFQANTQVIVNTVNCKGVMGKGIALEFRRRYPKMYEVYKKECDEGKLTIGAPSLYKVDEDHWILNFPTKNHWRYPSKLEYIEEGLKTFISKYKEWGIKSIAFPKLGCQHGGLKWSDVKPLMEHYLGNLPKLTVEIYLHMPKKKKERRKKERRRKKKKLRSIQINNKQQRLIHYT